MARETVKRLIDGHDYEFSQFQTTQSLKVLSRLTRLLGEPATLALAAVMGEAKKAKLGVDGLPEKSEKPFGERDINTELLAKAVKSLTDRLDDNEVVDLFKTLTTSGVHCDNRPIVFDTHFAGQTAHLFTVFYTALEVQYGNFIAAVSGQFGAANPLAPREQEAKPSQRPIGSV